MEPLNYEDISGLFIFLEDRSIFRDTNLVKWILDKIKGGKIDPEVGVKGIIRVVELKTEKETSFFRKAASEWPKFFGKSLYCLVDIKMLSKKTSWKDKGALSVFIKLLIEEINEKHKDNVLDEKTKKFLDELKIKIK